MVAKMCDDIDDDIPPAFLVSEHRTDADRSRMRKAYAALADQVEKDDPELGAELHRILDGSASGTRQGLGARQAPYSKLASLIK